MDIHAGYYSSDYPNPCVYRSSPVGLRYREPTSSHVYRGFRYNKTEEIIHEINRLRQENAKIELQSGNIKEDISSHEGDILDKLNSLRLLNMKLSTSNPNRKETADVTNTKTQVDAGILFTSTDAKEYNGIPPRKRYLEPLDHEKLGDGISTQDIFDRIDKLEANVKKVIRKHCRPKRHQYRETTTAFHQHTVSHISCGGIAGSDFYPTKETTKKSKRHTATYIRESSIPTATSGHVGHERDFEAEAKRIVAEYHNSKERLRHEISRGNRNHSPDDKRISLSHEHGSQPYTNLPIQQDQHIIQSKGNVEERQPERESKQHNFHSKVSSIDTYRSDYTDKHTAKHDQPRNYASRNFQHIDEPIRKPKVWLKEERQSESEDTNTNSSRDQADNDCMLLILRPTRSVSGTIIGYDVAEDIPRNNTVAEMGLQGRQVAENHDLTEPRNTVPNILQNEPHKMKALDPLPNPFADKCFAPDLADRPKDAQQCTKQEIEIKIPFKLKLPRTPEGSRLSDDSQPNNVSSTLGCDKNTAAIDTSDSQLLSVQFCNEDAVSLPKANLERSVPVIRVYDEETELVTTVEQCHNKLNNGASTTHFILVLKREGQCGQVFDGNMEQVDHNEEKKYRTLDTEVRDGKITDTKVEDNDSTSHIGVDECSVASATVELTVDPATITPVYGFEQYSVTKENDTSLIIQEGDMSTDSTTEEETDERPTFTPVLDFALDSVSDEVIDEHPTVSLTSQLGITSVTEKNAVSKLAVDTDGNDKAVEEHPEITPVLDFVVESETDEDSVSVSLTDEEPDFHATNYKETQISGKAKDKSQCWGNYKEMSDTRQINEIKGITMKDPVGFPLTFQENSSNLGFPETDHSFPAADVEMTPVSRFYVSDSDSSCIDWSDEKKPSTAAVENKIKAGEKEGSDQEDNLPGMTTNSKTVVEKRSAYSDWDSGDDEDQEGKTTLTKDVKDILQLHENHKRWESSSKSDVTEENTTFVAKPVKKNPRYKRPDKERDITSPPGKPTVEDNVLDLVLASGSDWDSDNSEISLNEVSKSEGKRNSCQNPKTGIFLQNEGIPELALTGKKTYAVADEIYSPGGSNSHWDSDTGLLFEEKNAIKLSSAVNNHTESSESAAQDITEEKPTFSQNNPALKEVELSIVRKSNAESDWDSDESQKSSIHAAECDNGEGGKLSDINDSSDKPAEKIDTIRNLDFDSDWDNDESEKPSTGVNNDLVDDPNICTNTVVNKYTEDEGNPHAALNEDVVAYATCAVTDVDLEKEHSPGSDSDWDSDVGSLLEEPVKENTEKLQPDLSLAGDTHTESTPIADHDVTKDDPGPTLPVVTEITDPGESCHVLISSEDKASRKELDVVQNLNSDSDWDSDESEEHPDNVTKGENIEKKNIPSEGRGSADVKNEMDFFNDDSKSGHANDQDIQGKHSEKEGYSPASDSDWDSDVGSLLDELDEEKEKTTIPDPLSTSDKHSKPAPIAESDIPKGNSTPIVSMTSDILDPGESDHGFNVTSHEKSDGDVELDVVLNPNSDSDWDSDESKEHIDNITKGESVDNIEKNNIPSDYGIQSEMPETQTETRTDQRNSESDKTIPSYVAKGTEQPHSPFTTGGDEPRENEGHSSGSGSDWDSDCGSLLDELDEENKKTTKPDPLSTSDNHTKTAPFAESDIPKGNSTPIVPMTSDILDPGEADQRFKVTSHEKTGGEVELDVVQNLKSDSDWDSDEPERSTNAASKCTAKFGKSQASDNHTTPASTTRTDVTRDSQDKATPPMTLESLDHGESELKLHVTSHEISGGEVEMDVVLNPNSDSDCDSNESEEHTDNVTKETQTDQRNSENDRTFPSYVTKGTEHSLLTAGGNERIGNDGHSPGSGSDWDSDVGSLLDELDKENKKTTKPDPLSTSDNHTKHITESDVTKGNLTPIVPMAYGILYPGDHGFKVTSHEKSGGGVELDVVHNLKSDSDWSSDESEKSTNDANRRRQTNSYTSQPEATHLDNDLEKPAVITEIIEKGLSPESDWDSDVGSLLDEFDMESKKIVKRDLPLVRDNHLRSVASPHVTTQLETAWKRKLCSTAFDPGKSGHVINSNFLREEAVDEEVVELDATKKSDSASDWNSEESDKHTDDASIGNPFGKTKVTSEGTGLSGGETGHYASDVDIGSTPAEKETGIQTEYHIHKLESNVVKGHSHLELDSSCLGNVQDKQVIPNKTAGEGDLQESDPDWGGDIGSLLDELDVESKKIIKPEQSLIRNIHTKLNQTSSQDIESENNASAVSMVSGICDPGKSSHGLNGKFSRDKDRGKDEFDILQNLDSDSDWEINEHEKPTHDVTRNDSSPLKDTLISQGNQGSQRTTVDTNIEKKISMLNEMLSAKEPVREDIEEIKAELHDLLDAELDTDSDWSIAEESGSDEEMKSCSSTSQESSTSRAHETEVLEFIEDVEEETSLAVPNVISISDSELSGNNDDGKQATIHSREQNASSKDDWLNMLEDIDSDDSWNSGNSDGEYGSEENQNSRKCTGKDAHSYDDMPISQENKKSRLDTNIEKKASMLNEMLPAKEPVSEDIEEIKAELHELLDAELDTDSDWSSSMSQETSTSRVRERKVLEKFIGDVKEETSPNVPYVTSITDNKLPVSNDDGKCNLRQQTSSKDDLLDNLEDFISDGDWNRSDSNEKENQNKMCKEKDAQSSDDDFLTDLKSVCDTDGKVSIKATVVTTLDKVKQGSAPNESKYINSTPGRYEAKTLPQDSIKSTPAAGRESDVDDSDDLRDIETLLDGMSTYWSEKKKQSTDIAVLDRKEKPPENKSVINNEDGKRTVCQSCEKNASSKDDILDMLEDFDSDAEWNSGNSDGEYGSEENQNSRKCTRKDAQSSDDGFLADPNPCDAGGAVLSKATVVSTLGDVKQGPASSKSKYNDITPSQYGAITLPKDPIKSKSTIAGRDSDDKSDAKGEDDEIGGSQTDTKEGVSLCEVFEFSYSDSDNESIGFNEDEELDIMADIMSSDALTGTKHDQLQESGSSSCMYDTSSDEEERARGHPALEREGLVSTSNIHNLMYGQGGLSKTPVSDVISNAGYCDVVYDEDELDIMNDVMSFSGDVVDTPQRKHEPGCHGHKYETSSDEEERSQLKVEKEEFAVTTNVHKMMFGRSEIGDRVPDFSDMDYDDYDLDLNCSDICATETCTQTRNNNPAAPSSRHSDSKSTRSGECEDVKASDDKNDNTSVIRLSEGECILRNDYSLSSDADFRGYTYEPSSDEEVQVQSTLKAKEPLSNDGNSMWSPSERDSDRGLGSSRRSRDTALSTDKVGTNEDSSTRSKDDSLPCINRREDISVRRNHSISSGDFRDNSSESSSDESAPSDQRDVDSVDTIASEEYLDQAKVDNELLQMPTMSIKDVVYAPTLVPDDEEETDCALTTEKSMKSAMMLNFMQIVMEDKGAASEDSYTNLNESNNSRGQDRSPRRNSVERGNYSGAGATNQDCSCLSTTGTESGLLQEFKKPTRMADNVQIPPEHGHYGSHQHFLQQKDNRKDAKQSYGNNTSESSEPLLQYTTCVVHKHKYFTAKYLSKKEEISDENLHQSNDAIKSTQRRERVPQSNGDDKNTLKIEFPQFDGVVKITQMEEEKPLSSDAVKVASDRKSVLKSIGDTMVTQLNREIPRSNGVAKVTEGKLQRERHFTAKYLNRCQTQAPTDNTCSTCPKETATAVGLKSVIPQPKPKAYRSRQFTDKYLLKNRVKKHTRQAVHPQKEILAQLNNDTMSNHIKEQSNRTVDSRSRHYTAKYLTTRRSNADVDERTINQNAIRWPEEPPSYGMSDSSTIDGNSHMNNTLTHETSVGGNVDTLRKDSLIRATSRIPIDVHYRRGISVNGCRNIGS